MAKNHTKDIPNIACPSPAIWLRATKSEPITCKIPLIDNVIIKYISPRLYSTIHLLKLLLLEIVKFFSSSKTIIKNKNPRTKV